MPSFGRMFAGHPLLLAEHRGFQRHNAARPGSGSAAKSSPPRGDDPRLGAVTIAFAVAMPSKSTVAASIAAWRQAVG